jgi:hypothetical protein
MISIQMFKSYSCYNCCWCRHLKPVLLHHGNRDVGVTIGANGLDLSDLKKHQNIRKNLNVKMNLKFQIRVRYDGRYCILIELNHFFCHKEIL